MSIEKKAEGFFAKALKPENRKKTLIAGFVIVAVIIIAAGMIFGGDSAAGAVTHVGS